MEVSEGFAAENQRLRLALHIAVSAFELISGYLMTQGGVEWELEQAQKKLDEAHAAFAAAVRGGSSVQAAQSVLFLVEELKVLNGKFDALLARVEQLEAGR